MNRTTGPGIDELLQRVERRLSPKRFAHTKGVWKTALRIAQMWESDALGWRSRGDTEDLQAAALLHDVAKEAGAQLTDPAIHAEIGRGHELLVHPKLLHAPVGAYIAEREFGIVNPSALDAIAYHPTGHADFDDLGFAIFIADYIEPNRSYIDSDERAVLMERVAVDRYATLWDIYRRKEAHVRAKNREPHPVSSAFAKRIVEGPE